jgi:hypothetical protein
MPKRYRSIMQDIDKKDKQHEDEHSPIPVPPDEEPPSPVIEPPPADEPQPPVGDDNPEKDRVRIV